MATGGGMGVPCTSGSACGPGCFCSGGMQHENGCNDGQDNDQDLLIDCVDADCDGMGCGTGCTCGNGSKRETACNDGQSNDGDGATDCDDPDCDGQACGVGCVCGGRTKKETACGDGFDNDQDGKTDCADPDCVRSGTEICNDGIDNTCDQAIDCADPKCLGSPQCSGLNDGLPCATSDQCAGGKCWTEAQVGYPNGACSNSTPCTVGTNAGCHGGVCAQGGSSTVCRPGCIGAGNGASGRCRPGYACFDSDTTPGNNNNFCIPLCSADSECQTADAGIGCNVYSKYCESKDFGLLRYGMPCTSSSECETGFCLTGTNWPGGYCTGFCRADSSNCGSGGFCQHLAAWGDNVGSCYVGCTLNSQCRPLPYQCVDRGNGGYCQCRVAGDGCASNIQCCSGSCNFSTNVCN